MSKWFGFSFLLANVWSKRWKKSPTFCNWYGSQINDDYKLEINEKKHIRNLFFYTIWECITLSRIIIYACMFTRPMSIYLKYIRQINGIFVAFLSRNFHNFMIWKWEWKEKVRQSDIEKWTVSQSMCVYLKCPHANKWKSILILYHFMVSMQWTFGRRGENGWKWTALGSSVNGLPPF